MKPSKVLLVSAFAFALSGGWAFAQDGEGEDGGEPQSRQGLVKAILRRMPVGRMGIGLDFCLHLCGVLLSPLDDVGLHLLDLLFPGELAIFVGIVLGRLWRVVLGSR